MNLNTLSTKSYDLIEITNEWVPSRGKLLGVDLSSYQAIFTGNIQGVYLNCEGISGGAVKLTMCLSKDQEGDQLILPDSDAFLTTGKTTAAKGMAVWKIDIDATISNKKVYAHFKTDSGTLTINKLKLVYRRLG